MGGGLQVHLTAPAGSISQGQKESPWTSVSHNVATASLPSSGKGGPSLTVSEPGNTGRFFSMGSTRAAAEPGELELWAPPPAFPVDSGEAQAQVQVEQDSGPWETSQIHWAVSGRGGSLSTDLEEESTASAPSVS